MDQWLTVTWLALALILPISALIGHRLDWKRGVVMALAWAAIFAIVAAFFSAVRG